MTKRTMNVVKGVTGGIAAGMLMGYMGKNFTGSKKELKKKAGKALDTMSDLVDTVSYMFK